MTTGMSDHNLTSIVRKPTKQRFLCRQEGKRFSNVIPTNQVSLFEDKLQTLNWDDVLLNDDIEKVSEIAVLKTIFVKLPHTHIRSSTCRG